MELRESRESRERGARIVARIVLAVHTHHPAPCIDGCHLVCLHHAPYSIQHTAYITMHQHHTVHIPMQHHHTTHITVHYQCVSTRHGTATARLEHRESRRAYRGLNASKRTKDEYVRAVATVAWRPGSSNGRLASRQHQRALDAHLGLDAKAAPACRVGPSTKRRRTPTKPVRNTPSIVTSGTLCMCATYNTKWRKRPTTPKGVVPYCAETRHGRHGRTWRRDV